MGELGPLAELLVSWDPVDAGQPTGPSSPPSPQPEIRSPRCGCLDHDPGRASRRSVRCGPRGTTWLVRAAEVAVRWLRPGGTALLELGGDQAAEMTATMRELGFTDIRVHADEDGHDRAIEGRLGPLPPATVGEG